MQIGSLPLPLKSPKRHILLLERVPNRQALSFRESEGAGQHRKAPADLHPANTTAFKPFSLPTLKQCHLLPCTRSLLL